MLGASALLLTVRLGIIIETYRLAIQLQKGKVNLACLQQQGYFESNMKTDTVGFA
jgi:hypothetical protein